MKLDVDIVQRIKVAGIFLLQIYKVTTGTLLSLFVPQKCNDEVCTLTQNYYNDDIYHKIVLYWNMLSIFTFFTYYISEIYREEWSIKYLDIDNDKPDNSLKEIIKNEHKLDKKMDKLNIYYFNLLKINCFTYFINILLSIKLLKDNYHSSNTISCFLSFVLLVLMKLYNSWIVAYQSVKNDKMMSAYMCEFVSYNVLDKDYVKENNTIELDDIHIDETLTNNVNDNLDNSNVNENLASNNINDDQELEQEQEQILPEKK